VNSASTPSRRFTPLILLFGEVFADQPAQFSGKSLRIHRLVGLRRGMSAAIGSLFSFHVVASSLFVGVKGMEKWDLSTFLNPAEPEPNRGLHRGGIGFPIVKDS